MGRMLAGERQRSGLSPGVSFVLRNQKVEVTIAKSASRSQPTISCQPKNRGFVVIIRANHDRISPRHPVVIAEEQIRCSHPLAIWITRRTESDLLMVKGRGQDSAGNGNDITEWNEVVEPSRQRDRLRMFPRLTVVGRTIGPRLENLSAKVLSAP